VPKGTLPPPTLLLEAPSFQRVTARLSTGAGKARWLWVLEIWLRAARALRAAADDAVEPPVVDGVMKVACSMLTGPVMTGARERMLEKVLPPALLRVLERALSLALDLVLLGILSRRDCHRLVLFEVSRKETWV
jgi:hypothetical protein